MVGQVTRVLPLVSEVTLITDKSQTVPVQNLRNGLRAVLAGRGGDGLLELTFMPVNADFQNGDTLVTSGIDGVYPPGLPVAEIMQSSAMPPNCFARIVCRRSPASRPTASVLVLGWNPAGPGTPAEDETPPNRQQEGPQGGMMQTRKPPQILLLPVRPAFIVATLAGGAAAQPAAVVGTWLLVKPDFVALALLYWCIHHPRRLGFLAAWLLGLQWTSPTAALFGQHALAYTVLAFAGIVLHRRIQCSRSYSRSCTCSPAARSRIS